MLCGTIIPISGNAPLLLRKWGIRINVPASNAVFPKIL
jgi:hypothetical protein